MGIAILGERPDALALVGTFLLLAGGWFVRRPAMGTRSSAVAWALLTGLTIVGYSAVDRVGAREGPPWLYGWALFVVGALLLWTWIAIDARLGVSTWLVRTAGARDGRLARLVARLAARPEAARAGTHPRKPVAADVTVGDPVEAGIPTTSAPAGSDAVRPAEAAPWGRAIVAGLLINGAYLLVLYAYSVAPLAIVSPLRESAVVLATAWGILGLGEREGAAQRIGGAVLIALGGILVALG